MLIDAFAVQNPLSVPAGVATTACVAEGDTWAVAGEEL
jgi:hypothetical protein